ncbi:MAG: 30S ribosomal protein S12 methylthiotransferase RimO [Clostridia bacterium]|nr:30S ribosomal protein S12 methylthiotransferase RimO [Clostridia bacterium]
MVLKANKDTGLFVHLLSLGCSKNLVESEMMAGLLAVFHFNLTENPSEADIIIVNTCAFIEAAKAETIAEILRLAEYKNKGKCRLLLAVGCMGEKYRSEMLKAMPELDEVIGNEYNRITEIISTKFNLKPQVACLPSDLYLLRRRATPPYTAYLKIADGCDNCCSYCLIPQLKGPLKSRRQDDIVTEAQKLRAEGVQELVVIAQDLTRYGEDFDGKCHLPELLDKLAKIDFPWIRLLYLYPTRLSEGLLKVMAANPNICHYLDLPLQHINGRVLANMNREGDRREITQKLELIKKYLPDCALRTTVMVGFPSEDKAAFAELLDFLAEGHFTWTGVFAYSREQDTPAYSFEHQCRRETKARRAEKTGRLLAQISAKKLQEYIGQRLLVLVEEQESSLCDGIYRYIGRSQYQAPEVDGVIYFSSPEPLPIGSFVKVAITSTDIYDMIGEII